MKKTILFLAIVTVLLSLMVVASAKTVDSGKCGGQVTWTLSDKGVLTIKGTGDMEFPQYGPGNPNPHIWDKAAVKSVVIKSGVTSICYAAFSECTNLQSVTIPGSVTTIPGEAFWGCSSLKKVSLSEGLLYIYGSAFQNCSSLESITIPASVLLIRDTTFRNCTKLKKIAFSEKENQDISFHSEMLSECGAKVYCHYGSKTHLICISEEIPYVLIEKNHPDDSGMIVDKYYQILPDSVVREDGRLRYQPADGKISEGLLTINGLSYYIDAEGYFCEGRKTVNGKTYFFNGPLNTAMTGKFEVCETDPVIGGSEWKTYYCGGDGAVLKNAWLYYFKKDEKWVSSKKNILGTSQIELGKCTAIYYIGSDGQPVGGEQTIDGKTYFFYYDYGFGNILLTFIGYADYTDGYRAYGEDFAVITEPGLFAIPYTYENSEETGYAVRVPQDPPRLVYVEEDGRLAMTWKEIDGKKYLFAPEAVTDGVYQAGETIVLNDPNDQFDKLVFGKIYHEKSKSGEIIYRQAPETGFFSKDGVWHPFDGNPGWLSDQSGSYYVLENGLLATGWTLIDGDWYYFDDNVRVMTADGRFGTFRAEWNRPVKHTGWLDDGGDLYYFDSDGVMATGWVAYEGAMYYLMPDGKLAGELKHNGVRVSGWVLNGDDWIYIREDGTLATGWVQDGGYRFWLKEDGTISTGWVKIDDQWHFFNANGTMATGWVQDGDEWYYLKTDGTVATGWTNDGNNWYYLKYDGTIITGWVQDGDNWYYMKPDGAMATGWVQDGDYWFYLNPDGTLATGWVQDGDCWYYMKSDGTAVTGWQMISGSYYYFESSGVMKTGWLEDKTADGTSFWYWFDGSGRMATGWQEIGGRWEMFAENGTWLYTWDGN